MMRPQPLPGQVSRVRAERVLVIAPHYDDEVVGCGGLLLQLLADGAEVRVLFLSDGSGGVEEIADRSAYSERRRQEAARVARSMGIAGLSELALEDGALIDHVPEIANGIREQIEEHGPDLILVPSPAEITSDHRAAFLGLHTCVSSLRTGDPLHDVLSRGRVLLYEVNRRLDPDVLVDVGEQIPDLLALVESYQSQVERHRYAEGAVGLRRYRTLSLPVTVEAAEAYRALRLEDFTERSLTSLLEALGGIHDRSVRTTGPLVSVVIRTKDRPRKLEDALASVARSIYREVEVVLVNDGGVRPELPSGFPFPVVRRYLERSAGPAAAAQVGLETATGRYLCFLDDDDVFAPEHLGLLVSLALDSRCAVVYSDAAVEAHERSDDGSWRATSRRLPYSRDFDRSVLLVDNYIPFHTLLIERELAAAVGPFDESLPFFEDWDFLIRLSARTRFEHLPRVTCVYRHFRNDPSHVFGSDPASRVDVQAVRAKLYAKHRDRLDPATLAEAITRLRAEASEQSERHRALLADLERLREGRGA